MHFTGLAVQFCSTENRVEDTQLHHSISLFGVVLVVFLIGFPSVFLFKQLFVSFQELMPQEEPQASPGGLVLPEYRALDHKKATSLFIN